MAKIAVLSTAHLHTRGFLDALSSGSDGRVLYALWDDCEERGERHASRYGCTFVPSVEELLADPEVDGFLIASETSKHLELLEAVFQTRKPVFCDKPLVAGAKELKKLRKLIAGPRGPLLSGYFMPYFGDHRAVVNLLKGNFFGKVTRVRFRSAHNAAYAGWFDTPDTAWFTDPKLAGGGGFLDMGTHAIHLLRSLFGKVVEVQATIGNESGLHSETDDYGIALLRFESGVLGVAEGGWTQSGGPRQLEIVGSDKTLWHDGHQYQIEGVNFPREPLYTIDPAPARVDRLLSLIRGELDPEEVELDLQCALETVAIMDAAYASAAKGRWVKVS